jgi:hypothetical protein
MCVSQFCYRRSRLHQLHARTSTTSISLLFRYSYKFSREDISNYSIKRWNATIKKNINTACFFLFAKMKLNLPKASTPLVLPPRQSLPAPQPLDDDPANDSDEEMVEDQVEQQMEAAAAPIINPLARLDPIDEERFEVYRRCFFPAAGIRSAPCVYKVTRDKENHDGDYRGTRHTPQTIVSLCLRVFNNGLVY